MKFHLALKSGKWIGGLMTRKSKLPEAIEEIRDVAAMWKEPIVMTRVGKVKRGETILVEPR